MSLDLLALGQAFFGEFEFGVWSETGGRAGRGYVMPKQATAKMLPFLRAQNAQGKHIVWRPVHQSCYMLHDDADAAALLRCHGLDVSARPLRAKPGRLVVETSPGNYQVWIRADRELALDEKRHWLRRMDSDPGADPNGRWGRTPGFRNRKAKHLQADGGYPLSRLVWADRADACAVIPPLEAPVSLEPPARTLEVGHYSHPRPYGGRSCALFSLPERSAYDRGDDSATDFAWCLALMRRGLDDAEVARHLHDARESIGWGRHVPADYIRRTVARARERFL